METSVFVESPTLVSIQDISPNITDANPKTICTDSIEALSKLKSAGLNHHFAQPDFFTDLYCAGIFNKHCLLALFY